MIVQAHAPEIPEPKAHALLGQLNLGTGQFGDANEAPFESEYCRWVPDVLLDLLRPSYVILLGLRSTLGSRTGFDPTNRLRIDWKRPDQVFSFSAYKGANYSFRIWNRTRSDGKAMRFVQWPQHPSRAPMTNGGLWRESAHEFIAKVHSDPDQRH